MNLSVYRHVRKDLQNTCIKKNQNNNCIYLLTTKR